MTRTYFAPSALPGIHEPLPGALPQAVTFRAFGAASRSFHTVSLGGGSAPKRDRWEISSPRALIAPIKIAVNRQPTRYRGCVPLRGYAALCAVAAPPHRRPHPTAFRGSAPVIAGTAPNLIGTSRKGTALPHIGRQSRERTFPQCLPRLILTSLYSGR
jgi:hypothetical protein